MNEASQNYWEKFWDSKGQDAPGSVSAWQFGAKPDQLAQ
ncbi:hypothetical protein FIU87_04885 [Bacillus sp. THAF10]|nr:hypothetical protein FIU87_04885 [Bacillus sp. THAF10]